jgi:hypothetical protein
MRVFRAAAVIALMAGPAFAQTQAPVPRYGDEDKGKSPQDIAAEKAAEKAYKRSLGNIPDQGPSDPWGNVRSNSAPKAVAKDPAVKRTKTGGTAN